MSLLKVEGISIKENGRFALQDVGFAQQELQNLAIAGETGAGKSTLLKIVAGFVQPDAGEVYFEQTRVKGPAEKLVPGHAGIAYLSQQFELPKSLRVEQVLRYANTLGRQEAARLYEVCRIDHLLDRRTDHLSGGERQRIALARLLTSSPRLLLLDEPYSNLDRVHKDILKSVIQDIGEQLSITCTLISHDPHDTLSWADEILVLQEGQVQQQAPPELIYRQPANEYTAALFGSYTLLPPTASAAFSRYLGLPQNGKRMLIRPENVRVAQEVSQGMPGTVESVRFFGSYYELAIHLADVTIKAKTTEANAAKGDTRYITVAPDKVWYL
ncbi:ABC transporter ATP-binding protein [Pontibacter sp. E15-1]|uniref:ABC transporter ATP-binding protein n=1 Tax=Pontibacter sp. E15-1 TaxID=2919918 RepID=UPI001F503F37|nr:ABC transporter ATP-binding protein [Pontibacter sp. E15-1]MCJ8164144.1 ABC transporter ATP-binding protein [Pontibacter sp. E15-1]